MIVILYHSLNMNDTIMNEMNEMNAYAFTTSTDLINMTRKLFLES